MLMKRFVPRLTYANVVATVAMFLALGGVGYAASQLPKNSVGAKQLRKNAVATGKIKKNAVTAAKIKAAAVNGAKIAEGSITATKLADAAVLAQKLAPTERSEGFVTSALGQTTLTEGASTTVATLNLPAGNFIVIASADLGNVAATANVLSCQLRDDGTVVAGGSANLPPLAAFSDETSLTGASDGGAVTLACEPDKAALARDRVITAMRVGTLNGQ
jgi:hypothetical protein